MFFGELLEGGWTWAVDRATKVIRCEWKHVCMLREGMVNEDMRVATLL
jgi:hypothetical protein